MTIFRAEQSRAEQSRAEQSRARNSNIEFLKIVAILVIVVSHCTGFLDVYCNLGHATSDLSLLIITIIRYGGWLGNIIFFVASAWFLVDSNSVKIDRVVRILFDVWIVSVFFLLLSIVDPFTSSGVKLFIKSLFPTIFANNWYLTFYIAFYLVHGSINSFISSVSRNCLLVTTGLSYLLCLLSSYIYDSNIFGSLLLCFLCIYLLIAYVKKYLMSFVKNVRVNLLLLIIGIAGNATLVTVVNYMGLRIVKFEDKLFYFAHPLNPFLIIIALSLLNIFVSFKPYINRLINYIASLSLLIYIVHENIIWRTIYRPQICDLLIRYFGVSSYGIVFLINILIHVFLGMTLAMIYNKVVSSRLHKCVYKVSDWIEKKVIN